jgi:hypothetical protein
MRTADEPLPLLKSCGYAHLLLLHKNCEYPGPAAEELLKNSLWVPDGGFCIHPKLPDALNRSKTIQRGL